MTSFITLVILANLGLAQGAAYSSYLDTPYTSGDSSGDSGDGGNDTGLTYNGFTVSLPQNNCGYSNVDFDTSLNSQFASNDTVWFFDTNLPSNCGPQESELGCVSEMYMTGPYSFLGYVPYSVNYYFTQVGSDTLVSLYYNYNNSATHLVGTVPCNGVKDYQFTLSKCMFNEQLYNYQFYTQYKFNFYLSCSYDDSNNQVNFNLDQESLTCVGGPQCNFVRNRFNLVNFKCWDMKTAYVDNGAGQDFCPPPPPPPPTTTTVSASTVTVVPTTTVTVAPTVTSTTCKSCNGGDVVININNSNSNSNSASSDSSISV